MTWTVTKEEATKFAPDDVSPPKLHIRAVIDVDNDQTELKDLIALLQKHVKEN